MRTLYWSQRRVPVSDWSAQNCTPMTVASASSRMVVIMGDPAFWKAPLPTAHGRLSSVVDLSVCAVLVLNSNTKSST